MCFSVYPPARLLSCGRFSFPWQFVFAAVNDLPGVVFRFSNNHHAGADLQRGGVAVYPLHQFAARGADDGAAVNQV